MATETATTAPSVHTAGRLQSMEAYGPNYIDPQWSQTRVNYYKDDEQPLSTSVDSTPSEHELRIQRRSDESSTILPVSVCIRNVQERGNEYRLAIHGFTIGHLDSQMQDWHNDSELRQVYFPEVTELLKHETGAQHVFLYEWHVRSTTLEDALKQDSTGAVDIKGPVRRVHIDETPASGVKEFQYYMKPDAPGNEHLRGRPFGIYNVWKPIKTVHKDPLCLCDVRTVEDEDLHVTSVCVPNMGEIENISLRAPKDERKHIFVYLRQQRPDQAFVFRIFDSRVDSSGTGKRSHGVPHTSFVDPGTEGEAPRQSVEVRSFCVF